jgi:hypothetical protein
MVMMLMARATAIAVMMKMIKDAFAMMMDAAVVDYGRRTIYC